MAFPKCTSAAFSSQKCPLRSRSRPVLALRSPLGCGNQVAQRSSLHQVRKQAIVEWCKPRGKPLYAALEGTPPIGDPGASEGGQPNMEAMMRVAKMCVGLCLGAGVCAMCVMFASRLGALATGVASGTSPKGLSVAAQGAWAGLSAGCLHTLAGPDHLAGLAPLTIGHNKIIAAAMGSLWGFGHSSAQLCLGLIFILLKERFKSMMPALSTWSGAVVGLTLVAIGVLGIYESLNVDEEDIEAHDIGGEAAKVLQAPPRRRVWGTYLMGFVHGLQPDSLYLVLPALALPTKLAAVAYISMFVTGTVVAMGGYCLAIGTASEAAQEKPWLARNLPIVTGAIAVIVGLAVLLNELGIHVPFIS